MTRVGLLQLCTASQSKTYTLLTSAKTAQVRFHVARGVARLARTPTSQQVLSTRQHLLWLRKDGVLSALNATGQPHEHAAQMQALDEGERVHLKGVKLQPASYLLLLSTGIDVALYELVPAFTGTGGGFDVGYLRILM